MNYIKIKKYTYNQLFIEICRTFKISLNCINTWIQIGKIKEELIQSVMNPRTFNYIGKSIDAGIDVDDT